MNIQSVKKLIYKEELYGYKVVTDDNVNYTVPVDPDNRHYQAILEWSKIEGNTIQDAD